LNYNYKFSINKIFSKEDYISFLKSIDYPECKIEELIHIKFNKILNNCFQPLESNQQINTIMKTIKNINQVSSRTNSFTIENRLLEILTKRDPFYSLYKDIRGKLNTFKNDDELYDYIRKVRFYHKKINKDKSIIPNNICDARKVFAESLFYEIKSILGNKINNYFDIGTGDGAKTHYLGNLLNLEKSSVFGIDFTKFHSVNYLEKRNKNVTFIDIEDGEKEYPIKSNKFDLVSAFMVAHHVKNLELFFSEIHRILKKGKYFVLSDHNSFNDLDKMLCDSE